jgi:hypothetical protein
MRSTEEETGGDHQIMILRSGGGGEFRINKQKLNRSASDDWQFLETILNNFGTNDFGITD